jgi:hypothetical protein
MNKFILVSGTFAQPGFHLHAGIIVGMVAYFTIVFITLKAFQRNRSELDII